MILHFWCTFKEKYEIIQDQLKVDKIMVYLYGKTFSSILNLVTGGMH